MNYLKLQVTDTLKLPWIRASMQARGALVSLLMFCCSQENGGVIKDSLDYGNNDWRDLTRLSLDDVLAVLSAQLARWHGKDLVISMYDMPGQRALEVKRAQGEHGFKGGRKSTKKPIRDTHMANPHSTLSKERGRSGVASHGSTPPGQVGLDGPLTGGEAKPEANQTPVARPPMDLRALMDKRVAK